MYKVLTKINRDIRLFATTDDIEQARRYAQNSDADAAWIVDGDYRLIFSTSYDKE